MTIGERRGKSYWELHQINTSSLTIDYYQKRKKKSAPFDRHLFVLIPCLRSLRRTIKMDCFLSKMIMVGIINVYAFLWFLLVFALLCIYSSFGGFGALKKWDTGFERGIQNSFSIFCCVLLFPFSCCTTYGVSPFSALFILAPPPSSPLSQLCSQYMCHIMSLKSTYLLARIQIDDPIVCGYDSDCYVIVLIAEITFCADLLHVFRNSVDELLHSCRGL